MSHSDSAVYATEVHPGAGVLLPRARVPPAAMAAASGSSLASTALDALCEVCCEALPPGSRAGCSGCAHRYCARCVGVYWEGLIFSGAHSRLHCMFGGCGVAASDADVAAVVPRRVFRRMLYFRTRDLHVDNPHARFCPADGCWALVTLTAPAHGSLVLSCGECRARMCFKCERHLAPASAADPRAAAGGADERHECITRRPAPRQRLLFSLWATTHTKSCPKCGTRIQRSRGCSHMTCARCAAYFCWRCKGFLHADCNLRGRACVCDRILTGAAYSGLVAAAILGAPVLITGAVVGGAPWLVYKLVKRSKARAADDFRDAYAGQMGDGDQPYAFSFLQEQGGIFGVDELRARARYAHRARILLDSDSESGSGDSDSGSTGYDDGGLWVPELGDGSVVVDEPSEEHVCAESVPRIQGERMRETGGLDRD